MSEIIYEMRDLLFPQVPGVEVVAVRTAGTTVRVEARCTATGGACPGCDGWSERVHSSYLRFPVDLPVAGRRAEMALRVRRFLCASPACGRRTFVEQIPGLTRRHGRVTERLRQMLGTIGLALAGRAGARLAEQTGIMTSRSTLLRRVMDLPDPAHAEPTAVGVDDFALRRGHVYGTVIIDAETHQVLDLLPERDADTLALWLRTHPEIEVLCRDRAGAYADATTAAPQALQVADRFHLWQNLTTAVEKTVAAHRSCLHECPQEPEEPEPAWETPASPDTDGPETDGPETASPDTDGPETDGPDDTGEAAEALAGRFAQRAREHHELVHELLGQGMGIRHIARHLGWGRHTVQRYARAARWQDMVKGRKPRRPGKLAPYVSYLEQRWAETEGRVTVLALHREITERGFHGSYSTVRDWTRRNLPQTARPAPAPPLPSVREITGWLVRHPGTLTEEEELLRKSALAHCPELRTAAELTSSFAEMLTTLGGEDLPDWITEAAASKLPGISTFATGLNSDVDAVTAGLTTDWNSGPVEGAVNRIKMIKRQMFGRAGFALLRKRVLLAS
ncbi:ISL3 family transposase [Streptomyces sp. MUM 16J]|uniref:ISL3 family transposase n=1 Tax=Streptomyces sp. MUM 16J TaxID=2791988 RepID=UPI001F0428A1|nr:ISL3 family transposase [Streptomyces sp. MUM 16J]MCH0557652.1 ISL3 family transposase [Streptomyces sp. MUM 16J]